MQIRGGRSPVNRRWPLRIEQEPADAPGNGRSQQAPGSSPTGSDGGQIRGGAHAGVGSLRDLPALTRTVQQGDEDSRW